MPERTHEHIAALAVQLSEHLRGCTVCVMPIDPKAWHGVVLCPLIRDWLDLHFPLSGARAARADLSASRSDTAETPVNNCSCGTKSLGACIVHSKPDTPESVAEKAKAARTLTDSFRRLMKGEIEGESE